MTQDHEFARRALRMFESGKLTEDQMVTLISGDEIEANQ